MGRDRVRPFKFFLLFVLLPLLLGPSCRPNPHGAKTSTLVSPSNFTATAISTARIDLSWSSAPLDATEIEIEESTDGVTFTLIATIPASQTTYSVTGLASSTRYFFRIRSINATAQGPYSPLVSANTIIVSAATPSGGPPSARMFHSVIYDPTTQHAYFFGGLTATGVTNELWMLDLSGVTPAWSQPTTSGTAPLARMAHSAILDIPNHRMLVFGGTDGTVGGYFGDVHQLVLSASPPAWSVPTIAGLNVPSPRAGNSAIYDALYQRMILFDGNDDVGPFDEVWSLDLSGGTPSWNQFTLTDPPFRSNHTAVYDATNQQMIVFGGQDTTPGPVFNDVWALSLPDPAGATSPAWTPFTLTGGPSPRWGHSAVLNGLKMMVFGGYTGTASPELWQLNVATSTTSSWVPVVLGTPAPAARLGHAAFFQGTPTMMFLFGGGTNPTTPAFNDLWQFGM
ncbi:MAG TPA: kelch repeat-containing protein [Planctomycetota bacterium]|nr:kelch repeat-containing protein [Planctomycetota bacterium]